MWLWALMLTDELLVCLCQDLVILSESRASLSSPCKWPSLVTVLWPVSLTEAPPIQEVCRSITQSEWGAEGWPCALFNSPPNNIRASWSALMITHYNQSQPASAPTAQRPSPSQECVEFLSVCVWVTLLWNQGLLESCAPSRTLPIPTLFAAR